MPPFSLRSGSKNIKVYVGDKLWGLACNSIHFLDLLDWWTGEKIVSINTFEPPGPIVVRTAAASFSTPDNRPEVESALNAILTF